MESSRTSVDTLVKYYDAISTAEFDSIAECFDTPSKLISLYGTVNHSNREQIKATYDKVLKTWNEQGISKQVGYDKEAFEGVNLQDNIDLVHTRLSSYDLEGKSLQEWNCSYIIREEGNSWLISLVTSDNKSSKSIK